MRPPFPGPPFEGEKQQPPKCSLLLADEAKESGMPLNLVLFDIYRSPVQTCSFYAEAADRAKKTMPSFRDTDVHSRTAHKPCYAPYIDCCKQLSTTTKTMGRGPSEGSLSKPGIGRNWYVLGSRLGTGVLHEQCAFLWVPRARQHLAKQNELACLSVAKGCINRYQNKLEIHARLAWLFTPEWEESQDTEQIVSTGQECILLPKLSPPAKNTSEARSQTLYRWSRQRLDYKQVLT
ncbi:uncharacterized protein UDID_18048 [Ustilago sp. UG-2017a]|nr:uncharacterized protein UDID_18048 [Ustilago sp. UG-2017a]